MQPRGTAESDDLIVDRGAAQSAGRARRPPAAGGQVAGPSLRGAGQCRRHAGKPSQDSLSLHLFAAGDDLTIMVDLNQWWRMAGDVSAALDVTAVRRIAAELAELGVYWLEEPLPAADLAAMLASLAPKSQPG